MENRFNATNARALAQLYGYVAGGLISLMLGLTHILLNIFGLVLWLISPLRVVPVRIAKRLGSS